MTGLNNYVPCQFAKPFIFKIHLPGLILVPISGRYCTVIVRFVRRKCFLEGSADASLPQWRSPEVSEQLVVIMLHMKQ